MWGPPPRSHPHPPPQKEKEGNIIFSLSDATSVSQDLGVPEMTSLSMCF